LDEFGRFVSVGDVVSRGHEVFRHPSGLNLDRGGDCFDAGTPPGDELAAWMVISSFPASDVLRLKFKAVSRSNLRLATKELRLDCGVMADFPDF
jgi:hypothetical protein